MLWCESCGITQGCKGEFCPKCGAELEELDAEAVPVDVEFERAWRELYGEWRG